MGLAEEEHQKYASEMTRLIERLCADLDPEKCNILAGHLFVDGSSPGGSERSLTIGQLYAVTPNALPDVQYVALGHVHRPQKIGGTQIPARYAGSVLQLDFGEVGQQKSVTLVDLEPGKPAQVCEVPIEGGRKLRDIKCTVAELEELAEQVSDDYLRVTVVCDAPRPGLAEQVRDVLPHTLEVRLEYDREDDEEVDTVRGLTPREQFKRYLQESVGKAPEDNVLDLFDELYEEVSQ